MQRVLLGVLLLCGVAGATPEKTWEYRLKLQAQELPRADASGEYGRGVGHHPFWLVVAEGGLRGRRPEMTPQGFDSDKAEIMRFFPEGSLLTATPGKDSQTGFQIERDLHGGTWIRVLTHNPQDPYEFCLVRARSEYVRPVRVGI